MYTSHLDWAYKCGIVITDIADHFGTFAIIQNIMERQPQKIITFRSFKDTNINQFRVKLSEADFSSVLACQCPDIAYDTFMRIYTKYFEEAFPLRTVTLIPEYTKREPWFTQGLLTSSINKDKLYRIKLKHPNNNNINAYKTYCKVFNKIKKGAKKQYYENILYENKSNVKQTWSILKNIINRSSKSNGLPSSFMINDTKITNPSEISEGFNIFFSNIGQSVSDNVPKAKTHFTSYLRGHHPNSMYLTPVDESEIIETAKKLKAKISLGHDQISTKLLKDTIDIIVNPLTHIFNLSITSGVVPTKMKIAKVIPIFKNGTKDILNNYRPISLLPAFSKLLEKLICKRLVHFLENNNVLFKHQYGFRTKHSTIHPILHMLKHITDNNDKPSKDITLGIFLDLSKAFDTICHNTLLKKLKHYGIRGICNDWFRNYLLDRQQYTDVNKSISSLKYITCGVPQGSILGPILFLIYINDISCCTKLNLLSYADDTTMYSSDANLHNLEIVTNIELRKLDEWFRTNKLALNVSKTKFSIFSPNKIKSNNIQIAINDTNIERDQVTKFLGLHLDEQLSWKEHIKKLRAKLASSIFVINRVKNYLPHDALKTVYYTLIHSHLIYGIQAWGGSPHIEQLYKIQKKALRLINHTSYRSHTDPLFKRERILKIHDIYKLHCILFTHDYKYNSLPLSFDDFFPRPNINNMITRQIDDIVQTRPRTQFSARTPTHTMPTIWNSLSPGLKRLSSKNQLKQACIREMIASYKANITCTNPRCPDCRDL